MFSKSLKPLGLFIALGLSSVVLTCSAPAEDETLQPDSATNERIEQWIMQLDASEFAARNEASRNLKSLGPAACPALAQAALGESRERRMRALDILQGHFENGDPPAKEAAKEALEKIAASDQPAAAAKAKEILEPKKDPPAAVLPVFGAPAQIQIRVNAIGGGRAQRIQINNGVKQIETEEGNRKIKITEDPNKGIDVEITEKKDGKESTEKFQAKNADELKKKHPEAYKVYEKLNQQGGGIQIQAAAVPGGVLPIQPALPRNVLPAEMQRQMAIRMLQSSRRMLESSIQRLEQNKGDGDNAKKLDESLQRLKELSKKLQEEEGKLGEK